MSSESKSSKSRRQSDLRLRRRRLELRIRTDNEGPSTLFARLSPATVSMLQTDALCRAQDDQNETTRTSQRYQKQQEGKGWRIADQKETTDRVVDFLPLSVKFSADVTIIVSYNGGHIQGTCCEYIGLCACCYGDVVFFMYGWGVVCCALLPVSLFFCSR